MTDADLARWEALCDAATPGPWVAREMDHYGDPGTGFGWVETADGVPPPPSNCHGREVLGENSSAGMLEDAEFIAEARTALPDLLAEVRRLRAELSESRETCWCATVDVRTLEAAYDALGQVHPMLLGPAPLERDDD